MASVGGTVNRCYYWCFECHETVRPTGSELMCPVCNGMFVAEVGLPSDPIMPTMHAFAGDLGPVAHTVRGLAEGPGRASSGFRRHWGGSQTFSDARPALLDFLEVPADEELMGPSRAAPRAQQGHAETYDDWFLGGVVSSLTDFNSMMLLEREMHEILAGGGNVESLIAFIQQLSGNEPISRSSSGGAPPASVSAIEAMPMIQISEKHVERDTAQCAVCKDESEIGAQVRQMPCKHMYHGECILPWLAHHNSCPVCRYQMPTDH